MLTYETEALATEAEAETKAFSKNDKKVILFNSILTVSRCDDGYYNLFIIFAVFDVLVTAFSR